MESLVRTREPLHYEFRNFTFASQLVKKGAQVAVVLQAANSIQNERNHNSGATVADETVEDSRPVIVRLYHDGRRPSALDVPFAAPEG